MKVLEKIDLVEMTKVPSENCFTSDGNGNYIPDYKRVVVEVTNNDGSKKKYIICRQNVQYKIGCNHHIESYTLTTGPSLYQEQQNGRWKWYDDETFDKKLIKLAKELSKLDYEVRVS